MSSLIYIYYTFHKVTLTFSSCYFLKISLPHVSTLCTKFQFIILYLVKYVIFVGIINLKECNLCLTRWWNNNFKQTSSLFSFWKVYNFSDVSLFLRGCDIYKKKKPIYLLHIYYQLTLASTLPFVTSNVKFTHLQTTDYRQGRIVHFARS